MPESGCLVARTTPRPDRVSPGPRNVCGTKSCVPSRRSHRCVSTRSDRSWQLSRMPQVFDASRVFNGNDSAGGMSNSALGVFHPRPASLGSTVWCQICNITLKTGAQPVNNSGGPGNVSDSLPICPRVVANGEAKRRHSRSGAAGGRWLGLHRLLWEGVHRCG